MAETDERTVLGVERSVAGRRWRARLADDRAASTLAQSFGLPDVVARVMAGRGVDAAAAASFLSPRLRDLLPDPSHLLDMDRAVERLAAAVRGEETVAVFGDYDVDGATSAALLQRFLEAVGAKVVVYVPDRLREGYGPNAPALLELKARGAAVAVTVDCGVTAHGALAEAAAAGLDVIVIDHHVAEPRLPPALAIVNPNRLDETSPHRQLAAVGVAFLLAIALNRRLRAAGWYRTRVEPDLMELLDLVALGTVADVVPLTGLNRALVVQGLKIMAARRRPGLAALAEVARAPARCDAWQLGFLLGPRVNAGGRVGEADLGVRLLATDDPTLARDLARRLDDLNRERQAIEATVLEQAIGQIESGGGPGPAVFVVGTGWHPGVIGIVASRLKDRYERPACVIALDGSIGRGSGRSANGLDLGAAIIAARQAGLLINGGGHPNAAGFTVAAAHVDALRRHLCERIAAEGATRDLRPTLSIDAVIGLRAATAELIEQLGQVGPFGSGNPEPRFVFPAASVGRADVVGERHVRCFLSDASGGRLAGIAFRSVGSPLGRVLLDRSGAPLHLAGRLRAETWQGQLRIQLQIEDAAPV